MHIPDGYLSPSTCAVLYGAAVPFWYAAFARVKRMLNTRLVPLLAVASAFCFVIMMFNIPLPGGTTGHAVGVGAADGRAGALGFHAFTLRRAADTGFVFRRRRDYNAGCELLQYGDCGFAGGLSGLPLGRGQNRAYVSRRTMAAALAGYAAINASALLTACELGIQPLFFKDASGAPLYAPYSLHVAIPAMMIGHLTFAGLAGFSFRAEWWHISSAQILRCWSRDFRQAEEARAVGSPPSKSGWRPTGPLWIRLALLMLLTPLGILAAGTAWGEWSVRDFSSPEMRRRWRQPRAMLRLPHNNPGDWSGSRRCGARRSRSMRLHLCGSPPSGT